MDSRELKLAGLKLSQSQSGMLKRAYFSNKCRICTSPHAHTIDQMLLRDIVKYNNEKLSYTEIIDWASEQGITISKPGLSRHRREHLETRIEELTQPAQGSLEELITKVVRREIRQALKDFQMKQVDE